MMDFTRGISSVPRKFTCTNKTFTILLVIILSSMILTAEAFPKTRIFFKRMKACRGRVKNLCDKLSSYCNPRILKRSIIDDDFQTGNFIHKIFKKSHRKHFHVNCRICDSYCW